MVALVYTVSCSLFLFVTMRQLFSSSSSELLGNMSSRNIFYIICAALAAILLLSTSYLTSKEAEPSRLATIITDSNEQYLEEFNTNPGTYYTLLTYAFS